MTYPHPMDDKTGHEATDEEMGLRKPSPMESHLAQGNRAAPPKRARAEDLAAVILGADTPARLIAVESAARSLLSNWDEFGTEGGLDDWMEGLRAVLDRNKELPR